MTIDEPFGVARTTPYADFYRDFEWTIPETFNFATDVVDRWADENDGPALIWENSEGKEAVYRYSDVARLSRQFADILRREGIQKGDRVIVMLPRIPEWQIAITACLRLGAVAVPCIEMLTERDIVYRVQNAEARGAVCRAAQTQKFASVANEVPVRIALGEAGGWMNYHEAIGSADELSQPAIVAAEDPAIMYYTSGSTGQRRACFIPPAGSMPGGYRPATGSISGPASASGAQPIRAGARPAPASSSGPGAAVPARFSMTGHSIRQSASGSSKNNG